MKTSSHFPKNEHLKSRKAIQQLFMKGKSAYQYPIKIVFHTSPKTNDRIAIQAGVSVSKRNFKNAVDRNRIKRQLRELFRLHKDILYDQLPQDLQMDLMVLYVSKQKEAYHKMEKAYLQLIKDLL